MRFGNKQNQQIQSSKKSMDDSRKTAIVLESGVHRQRSFILEKRKEKQNAFKVFFKQNISEQVLS
jgi:hypothetical protein